MARAYRANVDGSSQRALREYEKLEYESLEKLDHIFTFGAYVRDNIIAHYGIPADRVTAVGSGMGQIEPYFGPKTYSPGGRMLFVAKHLFREKRRRAPGRSIYVAAAASSGTTLDHRRR